ncbi:MAG: thioredoxin family protein [Campylobacterota bacterium]|nr:thioredoxin family protein [Campylobacterota bacterium]
MELFNLKYILSNNDAVMLYFGGENCSVCKTLHPKIKKEFEKIFPKIKQFYIDIDEQREIAIESNVFVMPTIVIFFGGKEFIRKSRNLSVQGFIDEVSRPYNLFFN